MDKVKIKVKKLLEIVRANRKKHIEAYEESQNTYWEQVKEWAVELNNRLSSGHKPESLQIDIPKPISFVHEYDKMISKLLYTVDDTVELTDAQFNSYVMDNWHWKGEFAGIYSSITRKALL